MKTLRLILLTVILSVLAAHQGLCQMHGDVASGQDIIKAVSQARGKVVVLNFWASWCGPCREEIPELIALRKRLPEDKVLFLGVSLDQDEKMFAMFKAKAGFDYPVFMAGPDVAPAFFIRAIPRTVVYSPKGEVVHSEEGYFPAEELEKLIKKYMGS